MDNLENNYGMQMTNYTFLCRAAGVDVLLQIFHPPGIYANLVCTADQRKSAKGTLGRNLHGNFVRKAEDLIDNEVYWKLLEDFRELRKCI